MNPRIVILMPTRGRPWSAMAAISSLMSRAADPGRVAVLLGCDIDDVEGRTGLHLTAPNVRTVEKDRLHFIGWINLLLEHYLPESAEWFAWFGDDCRMVTDAWDNIVLSQSKLVVYGPDGIHNEKMATHPFISTHLVKAVGHPFLPPELTHLCPDLFVETLGHGLDSIEYLSGLRIEHLHFSVGKSQHDQTYKDACEHWQSDQNIFDTTVLSRMPELIRKVSAAFAHTTLK